MTEAQPAADAANGQRIQIIPLGVHITPEIPKKRINDAEDLAFWLSSKAYVDLVTFIGQLNRAMVPLRLPDGQIQVWQTQSVHITQSPQVMRIKVLIQTLASIAKDTAPEPGPRRFGNMAFRTWYQQAHTRMPDLLQQALPTNVWEHVRDEERGNLKKELAHYLMASFGSPERLDYGTGHELSFLAFLCGVWKLHGFAPSQSGEEERGIVVGVLETYFELVRILIKKYNLEPAGSHGVWGLDDHAFIPFIVGSAQLNPAVASGEQVPPEGSYVGAPLPTSVINEQQVRALAPQNLFFAAIAFIYDVKKGPFWEHSPILYDISGLEKGWAKINTGLNKMYHAEVLAKFPVVQHLPFGSLLRWEHDPRAKPAVPTVHSRSQPSGNAPPASGMPYSNTSTARPSPPSINGGTAAPWARQNVTSQSTSSYRQPPQARHKSGMSIPPVVRFGQSGSSRSDDRAPPS